MARTVILATGAEYRGLPIENLASFNGAGVYYLATPMEAQLCKGEDVIIVGGGNSAGQAAVYLAEHGAPRDHAGSIGRTGGDDVALPRAAHRRQSGDRGQDELPARCCSRESKHLESVRCRNKTAGTDTVEDHPPCVRDDGSGAGNEMARRLRRARRPRLHQDRTRSLAGGPRRRAVAAASVSRICWRRAFPASSPIGDVRGGNIKRVASAVGEGSIAIAFVHQVLRE